MVTIGQKYRAVYVVAEVRVIVAGDIDLSLKHCCALLDIFILLTDVYLNNTQNALFSLHCNNCYTKALQLTVLYSWAQPEDGLR